MNKILLTICAAVTWPCLSAWGFSPPDTAIIASNAPSANGWKYRSQSLAKSVNALRAIGKEKCLAALRDHLRATDDRKAVERVTLLGLCLFKNPTERWDKPALGRGIGYLSLDVEESIPKFPLYYFEDVPFLIIVGYRGGGQIISSPDKFLKQCESLELIDKDIPLTGHAETAKKLIQTPTFKGFYSRQGDIDYMTKMVLEQAEDVPLPEK